MGRGGGSAGQDVWTSKGDDTGLVRGRKMGKGVHPNQKRRPSIQAKEKRGKH